MSKKKKINISKKKKKESLTNIVEMLYSLGQLILLIFFWDL